MKEKSIKQQIKEKKFIRACRNAGITAFVVVLLLFGIIGLLIPLRPSVSDKENRTLTAFPQITWSTFWNGAFFSEVSLWYSDTFPMRDRLIAMDQGFEKLYGITPKSQMIGGSTVADEIPDTPSNAVVSADATQEEDREPTLPDSTEMEAEIQNQIQDGVYIDNGAAYSMYYFVQNSADTYIQGLEHAAQELAPQTKVYSILVPNQSGVMLDLDTQKKLGGSDQEQGINYYYDSYQNVISVPTITTLREHNDEYLYFRTDHHWTQLAAYYIYQNFCEAKGIESHDLSYFKETMTFEPFLGTFYSSFHNAEMAANPDSVLAYVPNGTNKMTFWDTNGTEYEWDVITDVSSWSEDSGYACYIGGDRPLSIIENPQITDGSSCLVLKESYGNCFVPFLVDHYQTVYVIDCRYANVNVTDFVKEHGVQDLIVINNITIIGSESVSSTINGLLQ